jgi:glucose-6-phosphate 1-epimerase
MSDALPPPHVVDAPVCTGEIHDQGAHVTRWAPAGAEPVLYLSSTVRLERGVAIRGGVPVCWPWFGPGRSPGMTPAHGFVRTAAWELVGRDDADDAVTFTHRITSDTAGSPHWPHAYAVELRSRFGRTLEIQLTSTNTGDVPVDLEEALHAYLAVGDIGDVSVEGLDGTTFLDKVSDTQRRQSGDLTFTGETDAVFRTSEPVTVVDRALGRRLVVTTDGARNVVVWNPWEEKAAAVPDIGPGEWRRFVCVEGANVFESAVGLEPGESRTMTYSIEVEEL